MLTRTNTIGKTVAIGAIGGAVAGAVMIIPMMIANMQIGLPADVFPKLIGMMLGQSLQTASSVGIAMHMLSSTLIGLIFGIAVSVDKLKLDGFGKGIGFGIITGMISFAVLFLPLMMYALPPQIVLLMQVMNPDATQEMIMQKINGMLPMIINGSIISHVVYGAVLGITTTAIIRKARSYECKECQLKFGNKDEIQKHLKRHSM